MDEEYLIHNTITRIIDVRLLAALNKGTLVRHLKLPTTGEYHRALADAEMTASLVIKIKPDLQKKYNLSSVPHELLCLLQKTPKTNIENAINKAKIKF